MSVTVIIFIIVLVILLVVSMVLSAMSAGDINKSKACKDDKEGKQAHSYATANAVVAGVSLAVLVVVLIVYLYSEHHAKVNKVVGQGMNSLSQSLLS